MAAWRALVIDDSTTLRKVVEIAMRGTGCEVELAATGQAGVALARQCRPDVILLDYLLPDLRSAEVCERLRDDPALRHVPVIIMSANQRGVLDDFRQFPSVLGFIGKPFTAPDLRARLESAIRRGAATRPELEPSSQVRTDRGTRIEDSGGSDRELRLRGDLAVTPLMEVLRLVAATHATGGLVIEAAATARISVRRGEILLCSTSDDASWLGPAPARRSDARSESRSELRELSAELRERVVRNLLIGKPALVTLAEAGVTRAANLPLELHVASTRLIADLLEARTGRFAWEPGALPEFVEAFGRHVSLTALALEHARRAAPGGRSVAAPDRIYDRTPKFSHKLIGIQLDSAEQRVLALIDGRTTAREIAARAGLVPDSVAAIVTRLCAADLIHHGEISRAGARTLAVLDADPGELSVPLRERLYRRTQPFEVVEIDPSRPLAAAMLEAGAEVVLIGAAQLTPHVLEHELPVIAREGTTAVICVLDAPDPELATRMLQSGLHAVIAKPVHFTEIERLLSVT